MTSQIFANIYLNVFDQYVKNGLRVQHYLRYTDDFIILDSNRTKLENLLAPIREFLETELTLQLHPGKVGIRTLHQGIDFLGYVVLPHYRRMRTRTTRRIFRKLQERAAQAAAGAITKEHFERSLQSYLGALSHAETHHLQQNLLNWFGK